MSVFFNIASILLGLTAWVLPLRSILTRHDRPAVPGISFGLCSLSLLFQIFEIRHRIFIEDFSALADIIHAIVLASTVLLCITAVLNAAALVISKRIH